MKNNSVILQIKSPNSLLKFYRTPTLLTSPHLNPSISVIKETPYLLLPNENTFSIFNLQDLKLHFIGDSCHCITSIVQSGVFVYFSTKDFIYKTYRGSTIASFPMKNVQEMIKFGDFLILRMEFHLVVIECNDGDDDEGSFFINRGDDKISIDKDDDKVSIDNIRDDNKVSSNNIRDDTTGSSDDKVSSDNNISYENIHKSIPKDEPFKFLYKLPFKNRISHILHPNAYINKILIIFDDGSAELYNLISRKTIFAFSFGIVNCVSQTDILDVIALGMADGLIKIFNLKKNRIVFVISDFIGDKIKHLSFKDKFASILCKNFKIYNLELKKEVYSRSSGPMVYSGLIINGNTALITTRNSIELINLENFTILKSRKILNENIRNLIKYTNTEILFNSRENLFKMNIYRDEINRFLKTRNSIDLVSIDKISHSRSSSLLNSELSVNTLFNPNILLYGDGKISFIDKNLKLHNFINLKCNFIEVFKDFCLLGSASKVQVLNLNSKRILCSLKISENVLSGILENDSFTLLFSDRIESYDFNLSLIFSFLLPNTIKEGKISKNENMFFILNDKQDRETKVDREDHIKNDKLGRRDHIIDDKSNRGDHIKNEESERGDHIIDDKSNRGDHIKHEESERGDHIKDQPFMDASLMDGNLPFVPSNEKHSLLVVTNDSSKICRYFDIDRFAVDSRLLVGILGNIIKIYDIPTGSLIETIETDKDLVDIVILDDFKFVAVLDAFSNIHLLSNQSHFNSIVNSKISGSVHIQAKVPVIKKESNFYKDSMIYRSFDQQADIDTVIKALSKEEVKQMLKLIKSNIKNEFYESQKILTKLLLYKHKSIDPEDIEDIQTEVNVKLKEIEETVLKSIGYLNLHKNKLI